MSMEGARYLEREDDRREYVTDGSLALKRMEQRSQAMETAYNIDIQTVAKAKPKPKAKINVGNAVLLIMLIFSFAMGFLFLQTVIQQNNIEISRLQSQLESLEKEAAELELKIVMNEDIAGIQNSAVRDFGMVFPGEGQIVKIKIDESSLAEVAAVNGN
jgi:cell division protein FtsL